MRNVSRIAMLVGASVVGVLLSVSGPADAAWRRLHASACIPNGPADIRFDEARGGLYNNGTDFVVLTCPVVEDNTLLMDTVIAAFVNVTSNSAAGAFALACVTRDTHAGGTCGTVDSVPAAGNFILSPDVSPWKQTGVGEPNLADYPYIRVLLMGTWNSTYNAVRGYHVTG